MIQILFTLFSAFLSFFCGTYILYLAYVQICAKRPWKLRIDRNFQPRISILIPAHNEEGAISSKLVNVRNVSYPKENIEVIVADDASEDKTLMKVKDFLGNNPDLNLKMVKQNPRGGKSAALNKALAVSTSEIVIVSDVDTQWPPDILLNALPYLSDPKVGAVTGRGVNLNNSQSWVTKAENTYLHLSSLLRFGESKIHSTIRFEGGFCAYKRKAFEMFDCETGSDDSGTALGVVQNNYRTILVPEAVFYTQFPTSLADKLKIKARRGNQLISLWTACLRLMWKKKLRLPKRIVVPQMMLFIFNPVILFALIIATIIGILLSPFSLFSLIVLLSIAGLLLFARRVSIEILIDNLVLLYALTVFLLGRRYIAWEKTGF